MNACFDRHADFCPLDGGSLPPLGRLCAMRRKIARLKY
jgi:hypothetical protein